MSEFIVSSNSLSNIELSGVVLCFIPEDLCFIDFENNQRVDALPGLGILHVTVIEYNVKDNMKIRVDTMDLRAEAKVPTMCYYYEYFSFDDEAEEYSEPLPGKEMDIPKLPMMFKGKVNGCFATFDCFVRRNAEHGGSDMAVFKYTVLKYEPITVTFYGNDKFTEDTVIRVEKWDLSDSLSVFVTDYALKLCVPDVDY